MGTFGIERPGHVRNGWRGACVLLFLSLLPLPLAGCATAREPAMNGFCAVARLIRPSRADTPETLRQVLAHNEKVRRFCGAGKREGR